MSAPDSYALRVGVRIGERAIETLDGLDIFVNNAGAALLEPIFEITVEKWDAQLDIDLKAPFFLAEAPKRQ